jgi:hypothetical protein
MKKSEECFIGNCIYPAKLFIKNLFAKGSFCLFFSHPAMTSGDQ